MKHIKQWQEVMICAVRNQEHGYTIIQNNKYKNCVESGFLGHFESHQLIDSILNEKETD